jgi:hypothetical protein
LRNLSSNPDILDSPATWKVRWESPNPGKLDLEGKMDLRKESRTVLEVWGRLERVAVRIEPDAFGVQSLEGKLRTDFKLMFQKSGSMEGTVQALLQDLSPRIPGEGELAGSTGSRVASPATTATSAVPGNKGASFESSVVAPVTGVTASPSLVQTKAVSAPARMLEDLVQRVLQETKEIDATVDIDVSSDGRINLAIRSGIDRTVKTALQAFLREEEKRLKERAREEVRKQLSSYLAKNETLRKGWEELDKSLGGKVTDASTYQKLLEDKKKEAEQRIETLKKEAADRLLKEAQKLAPQLPSELPKTLPKAPSVPSTPSLPSTPGAPKTPSLPKPKL